MANDSMLIVMLVFFSLVRKS